ncbi:putative adhesin [Kribbella sp. VKM Ac-2527]|uniref:Putative adhesin n=1 Tax=Kribbella caucasensis TaxID=2512215 RepID=A0A4R6KK87_9ACTN|nr:DUF4097 family beta strand repeat-containing protein [Kribbella sp. VKM Ac-2527]TDO51381.1 putative adhesin [Kribbella sp. VKM Ac-2527]
MSEVQRRPASSISPERRYGIAISVALILGGGYWALTSLTEEAKATQGTYPVQGTSFTIESSSADLEVRSGDVREVTVDRKFERNVFGSDPKETYQDGRLQVQDTSCGFLSFGCDTSYVVTVPRNVKVTVESTSGDLKASDLPAGASLKTTSGNIDASNVGGQLSLDSTSGDVEARDLTASEVSANATSGGIELTFQDAPTTVSAEASSGDVTVLLPGGTQAYKVDADTSSGDESINVKMDPAATNTIKANTSSGDVTIEYSS